MVFFISIRFMGGGRNAKQLEKAYKVGVLQRDSLLDRSITLLLDIMAQSKHGCIG